MSDVESWNSRQTRAEPLFWEDLNHCQQSAGYKVNKIRAFVMYENWLPRRSLLQINSETPLKLLQGVVRSTEAIVARR